MLGIFGAIHSRQAQLQVSHQEGPWFGSSSHKDLPPPASVSHVMQAKMLCHAFPGHWLGDVLKPLLAHPVISFPSFHHPLSDTRPAESCLSFCSACTEERGTTAASLAPFPKALCCRTHHRLGTARLSWCRVGLTRGMGRGRSPRPHRPHQSAGAVLTMLQTLPPISCWIPVSLPAPASAKQSVKIEAGLHQNTIVNCSPERSLGRLRIAPRAGEKECLPGGRV